jgi:3-deoxy-D-manno-octulosonic-acid transferase
MNILPASYGLVGNAASGFLRRMLVKRVARGKEVLDRLPEREGISRLARPDGKLLWFHAASVGETLSVLPVIAAIDGRANVLLTTGTVTSAALAAERLPAFALHQFTPLDVPAWVRRFLAHWRPDAAVFVESEIWPATLRLLDGAKIPRLLINASMSARSARNWRLAGGFIRDLLRGFTAIHVQSAQDAANLAGLGAGNLLQWGNLKFAAPVLPVDAAELAAMRSEIQAPNWLAASTHPGEEEIVIAAHRLLAAAWPELTTVIVPRHPMRGGEIAALAGGLPVARRSENAAPVAGGIYIADTLGELGLFYRLAPFALIGGSLVPIGGHNITEAARLGIPVLCGPHTGEIAELVQRLREFDALVEVSDAETLAASVRKLLADPVRAAKAGGRARQAFDGLDDLPARLADLILASAN